MRPIVKTLALLSIVVIIVPALTLAAAPKEKKPRPFVKVESVSTTDNTIAITDLDGSNTTYTVSSFTTITVNDKSGKLADIQVGMKADIVANGKIVSRIDVTDPPVEKKKKK